MTESPKKPNYFVRFLILLFCIGLSIMIGYNFFMVEPVGVIKNGVFILLSILLILVLAESFDNFSIGKLITIKREFEIKKEENKKLEQKNSELINQILSITNIQTQKQQNTNVYGDYYSESRKEVQRDNSTNDNVQELIDRIGNSIVIGVVETNIKNDLQSKNLEIEGDTIKVLIRHLAGTQLLLEFERIHSLIFGSQLYLLKQLNISNGMSEVDVCAHFDRVKQAFSDSYSDWDCDKYLAFLFSKLLINKNDEGIIQISNLGVEYLTWIIKNGEREDKPL